MAEELRPLASILTHSHERALTISTRLGYLRNLATQTGWLEAVPHNLHHDEHFWVTAYEEYERLTSQLRDVIPNHDLRRDRIARVALQGAIQLVERDERAAKDSLTGAWRKEAFQSYIEATLASEHRPPLLGLLFFDLDNFKAYNDTRGHAKGDELLVALVEQLEEEFRVGDVIARVGGEELAVLLTPGRSRRPLTEADIIRLAERARRRIETKLGVTTSVGATNIRAADTFDTAYIRADALMYQAKTTGKNRVISDLNGSTSPA